MTYYLIRAVSFLFDVWTIALLARIFLSWFNVSPYHPIVRILNTVTEPILGPLNTVTEPILGPLRRVIPPIGMMDISPIVAILLVQVLERLVITALWNLL